MVAIFVAPIRCIFPYNFILLTSLFPHAIPVVLCVPFHSVVRNVQVQCIIFKADDAAIRSYWLYSLEQARSAKPELAPSLNTVSGLQLGWEGLRVGERMVLGAFFRG